MHFATNRISLPGSSAASPMPNPLQSWFRRFWQAVMVLALGGCSTTNSSHFNYRFAPTGLEPGDHVVALQILRKGSGAEPRWEQSECVEHVLHRELPSGAVLPAPELLKALGTGTPAPANPLPLDHKRRELDTFGQWLHTPAVSSRLKSLKIRYVVELEESGLRGDSRVSTHESSSFVSMGTARLQIVEYTAHILDMRSGTVSGAVKSSAASESGGGLAIIGFLPIPYLYGSSVREPACMEVAQGVADLILGTPGP